MAAPNLQMIAVMDRADLRRVSEHDFSVAIREYAEGRGWLVFYNRQTGFRGKDGSWRASGPSGWPDLFMSNKEQGRSVAAELKRENHRTDPERLARQRKWLNTLRATEGIEAFLWLPIDAAEALKVLK